MRLSNILALLLAPIALAYPIASPDSISINQRDVSAPIQARHQALSSRIMKVVDESQELAGMCKKYNGGMTQSLELYRQFKKSYKSVEHAEQGAKESKPCDEGESEKIKESLAKLTDMFVQISKYILDRKEMISGSRYKSYMVKELDKLRGRVGSFYDSCESKTTSPHKPDIKGYGKKVDSEFETVKSEILGKSKTRRSLWSRSDEEEFEGPVERFHFPHFHMPGSFNPRSTEEKSEETKENFQFPGLPDFPGFPSAENKATETKPEGEKTEERFQFPGLPDFPGFPSASKRSLEDRSESEETKENFQFPGLPDFPGFPSAENKATEAKPEGEKTEERFQFPGLPDFPGFPAEKRSLKDRSEGEETKENFQFPGLPDFPGFPAEKRSLKDRSEGEETKENFQFPGLPDFPGFPSAEKRSLEVRSEGEETEEPVERFHLPWSKRNEEFFKMLPALFKTFLSSDNEHGDSEGMVLPTKTGVSFERAMEIFKALIEMVSTHSCKASGCQNGCETGQNEYGNGQYGYGNGQNDYQNEENEFGNGQYEYENGQSGQKTSCQNKSQVKNFLQSLMDKLMRIGDAKKSIGMNQSEEK